MNFVAEKLKFTVKTPTKLQTLYKKANIYTFFSQRNSNKPSVGTVVALLHTGGVNSDEKQQNQQKTEAKRKPFLRSHCHFSSFKKKKGRESQRKKKKEKKVALSPT